MKIYAIIPARGGSKGVPGKNVKDLCGQPLIAWTIEAAKKVPDISRVMVNTDDADIARVARAYARQRTWGAPPLGLRAFSDASSS